MIWTPNTNVSALIEPENQFLMVEDIIDGRPMLNQPAAHLQPHESLIDTVIHETKEETAWQFDPVALSSRHLPLW